MAAAVTFAQERPNLEIAATREAGKREMDDIESSLDERAAEGRDERALDFLAMQDSPPSSSNGIEPTTSGLQGSTSTFSSWLRKQGSFLVVSCRFQPWEVRQCFV